MYLLLHQWGAWKYSRDEIRLSSKRNHGLLAWSRISNVLSIPVWTAASVLGLIIASDSPFCIRDSATTSYWQRSSPIDCKVQKAGTATTLAAL